MLRLSFLTRCASSGGTLTSRLARLAQRAEQHIAAGGGQTTSLWEDVLATTRCACTLKETDTTLAIVFRLLRAGCRPPRGAVWPTLIRELSPFSDIEANAVLSYPGLPESCEGQRGVIAAECVQRSCGVSPAGDALDVADIPPLLRPTRGTLLMTGGVVPLSARVPCSDGVALSILLEAFCDACEESHGDDSTNDEVTVSSLKEVMTAVVEALQPVSRTVLLTESSPLSRALVRLFSLLLRFSTRSRSLEEGQLQHLAEYFAKGLTRVLPDNALGARIVLLFLADHQAAFEDEMVHLPLVRTAARTIWHHYETHDAFPSLQQLQHVKGAVDVTLQRNANNGNPLALDESEESALRLLLSLALLRVMRVEATSPDVFLRDAVDIVDRCPMTLSIEYELIVAKVTLLDLFVGDESSTSAIYDDLLQSLRAIVELRPRDGVDDDSSIISGATQQNTTAEEHAEEEEREREEEKKLIQRHFQDAHRLVVKAFARSQLDDRLNQAYTILVTHKYHGLVITRDVANPLLDTLSRRGDCRVFNIVDLCVLYSGSQIDYETLTCLFRACRVANDFYRARTLYQLLREMIPGFLLRAPEAIKEYLRELNVLQPEPAHLFPASLVVDGDEVAAAVMYEGVINEEAPTSRQRGPIRELTTTKQPHTSSS